MIFGSTPLTSAIGAILAHGTKHRDGMFKKGRMLSAEDVAALAAAGHTSVIAAKLGPDDVPEDEAARLVSTASCGACARAQEPFTGRANLYATANGLVVFDEARLKAINHLHESLTIATLPNCARVSPKQMVATIKVIPFAVPRAVLEKALAIIGNAPLLRVSAFVPKRAGLIITTLSQTKPTLTAKSEAAVRDRLAAMGADLAEVIICPHGEGDVARSITTLRAKLCDPVLVFGASAIVDRGDVIPAAVVQAGGLVHHLGMPVDPGNLLMLADVAGTAVIGVPSCARSPKVNGFDWVLERLVADVPVTSADLMDMGAGGLLAEIPSRPSPREGKGVIPAAPRVVAVVLAAGLSRRMGSHKMLEEFRGVPMIRAVVEAVRRSSVDEVFVVTGHEAGNVDAALQDLPVRCVVNADYATGLASSLRVGIAAAGDAQAVVICLGDMPLVKPQTIDKLIAAFNPTEHRTIVAPVHRGQFGNPVLWGREHFARLMSLAGDKGARALIGDLKSDAVEIAVDDVGVLADADTPEALDKLRKT
ncbi:MAG: NTP transferase domain-containing protein [Phyllobacteriaceae bacterium]|nr:NTP transferase domain-containing protein [Phyllobacteriaceae bacterium]